MEFRVSEGTHLVLESEEKPLNHHDQSHQVCEAVEARLRPHEVPCDVSPEIEGLGV